MTQNVPLSVTIIALNEEARLANALKSVQWANEVIVVDSGSTDRTIEIAKKWGAKVLVNPWTGYGQQKNFAQTHAQNDWVFNLDADEEVSPELAQEIQNLLKSAPASNPQEVRGFAIPRKNHYMNRWVKNGGWYPNYQLRLAHKEFSRWTEPELHEKLVVEGKVEYLKNPLVHFPFESIEDQVLTNLRYAREGAEQLRRQGVRPSLLAMIVKPIGKFFETYLLKGGFRDGLIGFFISVNAAYSMFLKYSFLFREKTDREDSNRR